MATPNRLSDSDSPYLRQHRFDPVEWYPFGDEAFDRAKELDRPLFLSIGYSTCHWCHVMAHESFSDDATAELMNRTVVAVKVDREERPDVDAFYMEAVTATTGHGGWPMSVFATPEGRPFLAGTYFPGSPRHGMPSFRQLLHAVDEAWRTRRHEIEEQSDRLVAVLEGRLDPAAFAPTVATRGDEGDVSVSPETLREASARAVERLTDLADPVHGGFGSEPKFPQPLLLDLLLREASREREPANSAAFAVVRAALEGMASGGIYDQLGGGFHRYSVDGAWVVPHFEKMLYDQVLLSRVHLHAWQLSGDPRWRQVMDETLGYVLTRLRRDDGALYSAEDADSEGEEGTFYLWEAAELDHVLSSDLARAAREWYGVSASGNFEGRNVLVVAQRGRLVRPPEIESARTILLRRRDERVRPGLDDKVIVEWNAMACAVFAEAAGATGDDRYKRAAEEIGAVLRAAHGSAGGITPRVVSRSGRIPVRGFAGDVAWSIEAAVRLFELVGDSGHLAWGEQLAAELIDCFLRDDKTVVFTSALEGHGALPVRPAEHADGVIPSASSVAARALLRLGTILADDRFVEAAGAIVAGLSRHLEAVPTAVPELLWAAELVALGPIEVVAAPGAEALLGAARRRFVPAVVAVWRGEGADHVRIPLLEGREAGAVYVCERGACRLPARDASELEEQLAEVITARSRRRAG